MPEFLKVEGERNDEGRVNSTTTENAAGLEPSDADLLLGSAWSADPRRSLQLRERVAGRKWPILLAAAMLVVGMAFMFAWNPLVHHSSSWATGEDLWGIYRGAHYVGWGFLGGIYTPTNGIVTFPGIAVLLAPVAMLTGHLNMTESYTPFFLARPTAALVLQPIELLLGATVLFASDALAERLGVSVKRRVGLCIVISMLAWPVVAVWGHAEDLLALTFAMYAMVAMIDQKWSKFGWLLGVGIVMQPLVALMLPLLIGATPRGKRLMVVARSAALTVLLVGVAFLGDASDTYRALVKQPTPPSINHPTPWVALAPKLNVANIRTWHGASFVPGLGHPELKAATAQIQSVIFVAGGPGRSIDVLVALLFGLYAWRRPQHMVRLLWLAAVILASRCFFEAVMTPYYLAPPLILALVLAAHQRGKRFWAAAILAFELTVFAYFNLNPWVWWLPIVAGLAGILALGYPGEVTETIELPPEIPAEARSAGLDVEPPLATRPPEPALQG
jgi:hypothetical protein